MSGRSDTADILVVGLGPAGATAAAAARRDGAKVLAIDRKREAGQPVQCAEFVPAMVGLMLDTRRSAALGASWRQHIHSMATFVEGDEPHISPQFPGHMIDRAAFDASLVEAAQAQGAECRLDCGLAALGPDGVARLTSGETIRARIVIGADGPRSKVGRAIGRVNAAIAETRQITVPLLTPYTATDIFLSPSLPGGYAWLFPKGSEANLGLGVAPPWRQRLKPELEALHRQLVAEGRVGEEVIRHTGGAIPVGGMLAPKGRLGPTVVLLAGDAAGLANPVTGAGINAAVVSGRLAGEAAAAILNGEGGADADYAEELEDLYKASLTRALARRRQLLQLYKEDSGPSPADLQRGWIAFPQYWAEPTTRESAVR
jgi:digeranylgeranylglycerophospholipid reductase